MPKEGIRRIEAVCVHTFDAIQNMEGIGFDPQGREFFIKDAMGKTPLLFWEK